MSAPDDPATPGPQGPHPSPDLAATTPTGTTAADIPGPGAPDPDAMPRWVPRAIALFFAGVVAFFVARWLVAELRSLLMMLVVALFLSLALEPAVNWLASRGLRRGAATWLAFLGLLAITALFVGSIGTVLVRQLANLTESAPGYLEQIEDWVNERFDAELSTEDLIDRLTEAEGPLGEWATGAAGTLVGYGTTVVGGVFQLFTVALFTWYLVADGPRLRRALLSTLPAHRQRQVLHAWELAIEKTGGYIYSRTLLAGISALCTWVALAVIGVPYPVPLALWVGVLSQFVPVVGTYLAGAVPVLVALLNEPVSALVVLGFIVVYQQIENYLLAPRITARTMELHPAVAFGTVIAGAALLGPIGAVLALPAAAILQAFGSALVERHEVVESSLTAPPARRGGPGRLARMLRQRRVTPDAPGDPPPDSASG